MVILALDTTSRAGSIALARDGHLLGSFVGSADRTHAERLPSDLVALLSRHGAALADVDVFGVAAGPGSFTGLRIGIATIQGLAFAYQRPVAAISALTALAAIGARQDDTALVAAWIDARRHEVFSELHGAAARAPGQGAQGSVIEASAVGSPEITLERWKPLIGGRCVRFIGDGATAYHDLIAAAGFVDLDIVAPAPALAEAVAELALDAVRAGTVVAPHAVKPIYVRRPDAELARDLRGSLAR